MVETKRGHRLGRIIREGAAIPNTGVPGVIGGLWCWERATTQKRAGVFRNVCAIGDIVSAVNNDRGNRNAGFGILQLRPGIIVYPARLAFSRDYYPVTPGFKVATWTPEELKRLPHLRCARHRGVVESNWMPKSFNFFAAHGKVSSSQWSFSSRDFQPPEAGRSGKHLKHVAVVSAAKVVNTTGQLHGRDEFNR